MRPEERQSDTQSSASNTGALVEALKSARTALEQEKTRLQARIKAINAELAALPKLPTKRGPRKAKNGATESKA